MKKRSRKLGPLMLPLALIACMGLLLGALIHIRRDAAPQDDPAADTGKTTLFSCAPTDLASITITPPSGKTYTLSVKDGVLSHPDDSTFPIRSLLAQDILSAVCTVITEDQVLNTAEKVTDLAAFGLDEPRVCARITLQDGGEHTLRVGDKMQLGIPYRYFLWDDDPVIYAISADVYDAFSYDLAALHHVEQPVWDCTLWDKVTITGENTRTITRTDISWQLDAPFSYPLSTEATESFLSSVENIAFAAYVGKKEDVNLAAYGLDKPKLTLTMHQAATRVDYYDDTYTQTDSLVLPEEDITLYFGDRMDEYYVYCMYLDTVYTATLFQTGFLWNEEIGDLLDKTPLDVPISALNRLTVTQHDSAVVYDISLTEQLQANGELRTDASGNTLWDVHVQKNGESMDTDAFLTWYASLQQCAPENRVPEDFEPGKSIMTLVFEGESFTRTAVFVPLDALHTAVMVNGTAQYYFANTELNAIKHLP